MTMITIHNDDDSADKPNSYSFWKEPIQIKQQKILPKIHITKSPFNTEHNKNPTNVVHCALKEKH